MKSSMSGPFVLVLLLVLCSSSSGLTSVISKKYKYIHGGSTWAGAQNYCKGSNANLATIYTRSDLNNLNLDHYFTWISLSQQNQWTWVNGSQTIDSKNCPAAMYNERKVCTQYCIMQLLFICQKNGPTVYQFIPQTMSYLQALAYCRSIGYVDLMTFDSSTVSSVITGQDFPIWIGLHRNASGSWSWYSGLSSYTNWTSGEPSTNGDCVSISSVTMKMATNNCYTNFPFICMSENVFLVKVNMSWEEALKYCRNLTSSTNSGLHFDLLSVQPGDEHEYVMDKVREADTEEVWTALRFLADEWLWMNGADVLYTDLPLCPLPRQHCGALSKNSTGSVTPKDCLERKNFLCYSY